MGKLDFLSHFIKDDTFDEEHALNELEVEQSQINLKQEKKQLLSVHSEILKKIERIASIRIPNNKDELLHLLSELSILVKANKLSTNDDEESRIRNQYFEALCEKYRQSIFKLESISPKDPQLDYYRNILLKQSNNDIESYKNKKNTGNTKNAENKVVVIIKILFFLLICVALFFLTAKYIKPILAVLGVIIVIFIIVKIIKRRKG